MRPLVLHLKKWIGIDVSEDAYNFVKKRLEEAPEALNNLWKISEKVKLGVERPKRTDQGKDYKKQKYVYVFSNPAFKGIYKVGIAKNWKSRLYQYQIGAPHRDYKKELVLETPYYRQIEKYIHDQFDNLSEWVQGDLTKIIQAIKNYSPSV